MEVVTSLQTLMIYAHELGQARLSGDKECIQNAKKKHDDYAKICIGADRMVMDYNILNLNKK